MTHIPWTENQRAQAFLWRERGKTLSQIDFLLGRKPGSTKEMLKRARRTPEGVERHRQHTLSSYKRKKLGLPPVARPKARLRLSFRLDRDIMAALEEFAAACGKLPAIAARDIIADVLMDDARAHGGESRSMEAAE